MHENGGYTRMAKLLTARHKIRIGEKREENFYYFEIISLEKLGKSDTSHHPS